MDICAPINNGCFSKVCATLSGPLGFFKGRIVRQYYATSFKLQHRSLERLADKIEFIAKHKNDLEYLTDLHHPGYRPRVGGHWTEVVTVKDFILQRVARARKEFDGTGSEGPDYKGRLKGKSTLFKLLKKHHKAQGYYFLNGRSGVNMQYAALKRAEARELRNIPTVRAEETVIAVPVAKSVERGY